eukprot:gene26260-1443_t
MLSLAVLSVATFGSPAPSPWTKVLLTDAVARGAVCLDGSPGGYYIKFPPNQETNNLNKKWGDWLFGNEPFVSDHVIVYAKYCDGGSWTGENFTETIVNGKQIYYRGLVAADTVVYSGCSAGALTTYAHLDYVHEKMVKANPAVTVVGLADAMFSL